MKKFMSFFALALLVCVGSMCFISCSDDDDSSSSRRGEPDSRLTGAWLNTKSIEITYRKNSSGEWEKEGEYEEHGEPSAALFTSDGRIGDLNYYGGKWHGNVWGIYRVNGSVIEALELDEADTDGWEEQCTITSISGNKMETISTEYDDGRRYDTLDSFEKMESVPDYEVFNPDYDD